MKKLIFILKQIKSLLVFCFCSFDASFNQSHFFECFFSTFEKTYIQSLSDQIHSRCAIYFRRVPCEKSREGRNYFRIPEVEENYFDDLH